MEVLRTIETVQNQLLEYKLQGKSIGLVPTMGGLHEGHKSLVKTSKDQNDLTVCSIYVNPIQFNNPLDLENYPRSLERDIEMLTSVKCDMVFTPSENEMYRSKPNIRIGFGELEGVMEGEFRPGHFNGVGIVVAKLLNIVKPDRAYFGEKDLQQLIFTRQLVRDLNFGIEIVGIPTVRKESGLAMSSRNERLDPREQEMASIIYKALLSGRDEILRGTDLAGCRKRVNEVYLNEPAVKPEYVEFIDLDNLKLIQELNEFSSMAICTAAVINGVRLIDNIIIRR